MSVLITGGAGFIGRHTARLLAQSGERVVLLDNFTTSTRTVRLAGVLVEGDVADSSLVRKVLREHAVMSVIHLAASAQVSDSLCRPDLYFANNSCATSSLLESMMAVGVSQFVFASSCSVYGNCDTAAAKELDDVCPVSPYGESKLASERALPWYERAFGLRWVALRYFNVAGAEDGLGENIAASRRIIPRAVSAALQQGPPLEIYGADFPTHDGSAVRDFVHVADVARANLLALDYVGRERSGAVVNIGGGTGGSVLDVIAAVQAETGRAVPALTRPARHGDPSQAIADISRAARLLHWSPCCSDLKEIVASVVRSGAMQTRPPANDALGSDYSLVAGARRLPTPPPRGRASDVGMMDLPE